MPDRFTSTWRFGRVDGKLPLDAFALHDSPHGKRLARAGAGRAITRPLKIWMRSFSPREFAMHVDGVADFKLGRSDLMLDFSTSDINWSLMVLPLMNGTRVCLPRYINISW